MKSLDKSEEEIIKSFSEKKQNDCIFLERRKDTIMTPLDSLGITSTFTIGLMAMEPQTGEIKAWVGGINYKYFQYDHVGQGCKK
jgi:penicillin-binding protein 1A